VAAAATAAAAAAAGGGGLLMVADEELCNPCAASPVFCGVRHKDLSFLRRNGYRFHVEKLDDGRHSISISQSIPGS
jgi:hypothetical protein